MQSQDTKVEQFTDAFFNAAQEQNLHLTPAQKSRVIYGLSLMRHRWQVDHFHRIRNGELLAASLTKRVQS